MTEPAIPPTCPRCHGQGFIPSPPFWPVERLLDTMTPCDCPAGQQFNAAVAAQKEK